MIGSDVSRDPYPAHGAMGHPSAAVQARADVTARLEQNFDSGAQAYLALVFFHQRLQSEKQDL